MPVLCVGLGSQDRVVLITAVAELADEERGVEGRRLDFGGLEGLVVGGGIRHGRRRRAQHRAVDREHVGVRVRRVDEVAVGRERRAELWRGVEEVPQGPRLEEHEMTAVVDAEVLIPTRRYRGGRWRTWRAVADARDGVDDASIEREQHSLVEPGRRGERSGLRFVHELVPGHGRVVLEALCQSRHRTDVVIL